ncbi:MAG: hypothetical protein CUN55_06570 [Phototrophicales bacterium]|nr:MAG: hypothetical protein CUN55_06570 [Phototrophicales bacterium]
MLGLVQRFERFDRGVQIIAENATALIVYLTPSIIQVRVSTTGTFKPLLSYALSSDFKPAPVEVQITDSAEIIDMRSDKLRCEVSHVNGALHFKLPNGRTVSQDTGNCLHHDGEAVSWTRQLSPQEHCFGLGERALGLDMRGKKVKLWNTDAHRYERGSDPLYFSIPFYVGVHPEYALGVLWDNPARGEVDMGATNPEQMTIQNESGEICFYVMADRRVDGVLTNYFELTGRPIMPPLWIFGYHQSRYGYQSSSKFRELMAEFRKRSIPCDVLHFDIDYMDGYRVFTYDKTAFGDMPVLLRQMQEKGFKSIAILDPAIKVDENYAIYKDGLATDIFIKDKSGKPFVGKVWAGDSVWPDFTKPQTRRWWGKLVAQFVQTGFDAVWNDMNEPSVFHPDPEQVVTTLPDDLPVDWDGHGRDQKSGGHNVYGMQMTRASYDGLRRARPDKRPFVLTRSTYAGGHRYAGVWTGDNASSWDHMKLSISMLIHAGLSGMVFAGPDIGGFFGTPEPELYARWIQMAAFFPFCRTHTMKDTPDQEPWSFGKEVEDIARKYLTLRYELLPYLYSAYAQASTQGLPMIRPTFMHDPKDEKLYEQDDAFMVGDALFIAPVLEKGATSRELYLPRGVWYDYWTHKLIDGSRTITVQAPLDHLPLYVRAGHILPMWQPMQYVGQKRIEEMKLRVFAGPGESAIYEDAGEGMEYLEGEYRWSYLTCLSMPGGAFAINRRVAGKYTPPYNKFRIEIIGLPNEPESVRIDDIPAPVWFFDNGIVEILTSPFTKIELVGKRRDPSTLADTVVSRRD